MFSSNQAFSKCSSNDCRLTKNQEFSYKTEYANNSPTKRVTELKKGEKITHLNCNKKDNSCYLIHGKGWCSFYPNNVPWLETLNTRPCLNESNLENYNSFTNDVFKVTKSIKVVANNSKKYITLAPGKYLYINCEKNNGCNAYPCKIKVLNENNKEYCTSQKNIDKGTKLVITTGQVAIAGLKVRSKPTPDSKIVTNLNKNHILTTIEVITGNNKWYKVTVGTSQGNKVGYVYKKYIHPTEDLILTMQQIQQSLQTIKDANKAPSSQTCNINHNHSEEDNYSPASKIYGKVYPKELAANPKCAGFVTPDFKLGPWGVIIKDQFHKLLNNRPKDVKETFFSNSIPDMPLRCPNFSNLSQAQKIDFWIWLFAAVASQESSCKNGVFGNGVHSLAVGLTQLPSAWSSRYWRGQSCRTNVKWADANLRCSLDIMMELLRNGNGEYKGNGKIFHNNSYWGVLKGASRNEKKMQTKIDVILHELAICRK